MERAPHIGGFQCNKHSVNHVADLRNQFRIRAIRSQFGTNSIYSKQIWLDLPNYRGEALSYHFRPFHNMEFCVGYSQS